MISFIAMMIVAYYWSLSIPRYSPISLHITIIDRPALVSSSPYSVKLPVAFLGTMMASVIIRGFTNGTPEIWYMDRSRVNTPYIMWTSMYAADFRS